MSELIYSTKHIRLQQFGILKNRIII